LEDRDYCYTVETFLEAQTEFEWLVAVGGMRPNDWPEVAQVGREDAFALDESEGSPGHPQTIVHKDDCRQCRLCSCRNHPKPIGRRVVRPGQFGGLVVEQQTCTQTQFQ